MISEKVPPRAGLFVHKTNHESDSYEKIPERTRRGHQRTERKRRKHRHERAGPSPSREKTRHRHHQETAER